MAKNNQMMMAAVMTGPETIEMRSVPKPKVMPGHVLVKIGACAICTWEQRVFSGQQKAPFPIVGGHEIVGCIEAIGEGVPATMQVGDKVSMVESYCGVCEWCRRGLNNLCMHRPGKAEYHGILGPWGFSEYINLHYSSVHGLDGSIPDEMAVFFEPLSCAVHAARIAEIGLAEDVVILGGGPMGMLNLLVAKQMGTRIILSELQPLRLEKGEQLGAHELVDASQVDPIAEVKRLTGGKGADVVIAAVGVGAANEQALGMVAPFGRIVLFASAHPPQPIPVDPNDMHKREYKLLGAVSKNAEDAQIASRLLSYSIIDPRPLIEQVTSLKDIETAMHRAVRPDSYRVIVKP